MSGMSVVVVVAGSVSSVVVVVVVVVGAGGAAASVASGESLVSPLAGTLVIFAAAALALLALRRDMFSQKKT